MRTQTGLVQFVFLIGILLFNANTSRAQDPVLVSHFDYDQKAPLRIKQIGVHRREHATVYDITYDSPKGGGVPAYLVVPKGRGPFAAVIWGHWYWENSSMRNRREFLDEAIALAPAGVISLLIDGPIARPGHVESKEPLNEQDISDLVQTAVDFRRGVDLLLARKDVDPKRIAYVGHSYNAVVGAILSGVERRFKSFVLMAATMSDEVTMKTPEYQAYRQKVGPEKIDAFVAKYAWTDQGKYVSHAAPAVVFLQYGSQEEFLNAQRAVQYAAVVSEPKRFKLYDAPHSLNADARRDRIQFLIEQLKLKPLSEAQMTSIPNLYQPPEPN